MSDSCEPAVSYEEVQHFHPVVHVVFGAVTVLCAWGLVSDLAFDRPLGTHPAPPAVLALLLVGFVFIYALAFRLTVRVEGDRVEARFGYLGLLGDGWRADQIAGCEVVTYRPVRDYGGWGVRYGRGGARCYNARGNRGVQLEVDGRKVLLGSQQPEKLAEAIQAIRGAT